MLMFHNTNNIEEAIQYFRVRAIQVLIHNYKLVSLKQLLPRTLTAIFEKGNIRYEAHYILEKYRGQGLYQKLITQDSIVLTSKECQIENYLIKYQIRHILVDLSDFNSREYQLISQYYTIKKTQRSQQYLMNHIDEGLLILNLIQASNFTKRAYCLHPLFQADMDLMKHAYLMSELEAKILALTMEYRSVANEYLSFRKINTLDDIRLSPLEEVNQMLVADKIQNFKDFNLYHLHTHPRSKELQHYFENWLEKLQVSKKLINYYNNSILNITTLCQNLEI